MNLSHFVGGKFSFGGCDRDVTDYRAAVESFRCTVIQSSHCLPEAARQSNLRSTDILPRLSCRATPCRLIKPLSLYYVALSRRNRLRHLLPNCASPLPPLKRVHPIPFVYKLLVLATNQPHTQPWLPPNSPALLCTKPVSSTLHYTQVQSWKC